jgi:hypothetical protein
MWTRARLVIAVPYGLRALSPSAQVSQRHEGVVSCRTTCGTQNWRA